VKMHVSDYQYHLHYHSDYGYFAAYLWVTTILTNSHYKY